MEDSGIDSDPKAVNHIEDERLFLGSDSSCSSNHIQVSQRNTTKQLQKKLETRIEQAKRIQRNSDYIKLLMYFIMPCDCSEDEMSLFPAKSKDSSKHKQDLTDTFSIGELSDESEDSLNLDPAQPPHPFMRTYVPTGCFACHCHIL
ncbi:uncharacterized protein LOC105422033 [Pogonomyrmex barbatus]|uniref:Uncharacterized protein LOC105422033 n=1 Tax=Pogonomyrmex barbatus TaxID=144034 RepID=A0A6I9VSK6_9HYME|nr:uncharacterized protein LOC105422033 [Pogonomyrmex barbatus]